MLSGVRLLDGRPADPGDPAFAAAGVFTTMRVLAGRPLFLPDHLARLRDGTALFGRKAPPDPLLTEEALRAAEGIDDARVRVALVWGEADPLHRLVAAEPYRPPAAPWRLRPAATPVAGAAARVKTTARAGYLLARRAAHPADDAALQDDRGAFLETTVANLFFLLGDLLVTPPATAALLPGIARGRLLRLAPSLGYRVGEFPVGQEEARRAEQCLVTNALFLAHPVAEIEGIGRFPWTNAADRIREALRGYDGV